MSVRALRRGTMAGRGAPAVVGPQLRTSLGLGLASFGQVDLTIPAAVEVGDLMIVVGVLAQNVSLTTPAGWSLVRQDFNSSSGQLIRQNTYSRVAVSGDVGGSKVYSFFPGQSTTIGMTLTAWSGASVVDTHAGAGSTAPGTSLVAPSVTPTVPGTETIQIYCGATESGALGVLTLPTTERAAPPTENSGQKFRHRQASAAQPTATATGTRTATSNIAVSWTAAQLAIRPAS